jgi:hypothetical protein
LLALLDAAALIDTDSIDPEVTGALVVLKIWQGVCEIPGY